MWEKLVWRWSETEGGGSADEVKEMGTKVERRMRWSEDEEGPAVTWLMDSKRNVEDRLAVVSLSRRMGMG